MPINVIQGGAFSKEHRFPVKGWNSLRPYRIGIVRGVVFAAEGSAGMDVRVAADGVELMRWVEQGEVDVAVLPRVWGHRVIARRGFQEVRELDGVIETALVYHYVHERHRELAERLERVFKEMLHDGTTQRLLREAQPRLPLDS